MVIHECLKTGGHLRKGKKQIPAQNPERKVGNTYISQASVCFDKFIDHTGWDGGYTRHDHDPANDVSTRGEWFIFTGHWHLPVNPVEKQYKLLTKTK